jgi:hypothetical protein
MCPFRQLFAGFSRALWILHHELRVGHRDGWSIAQARFGPPLRVTGIQHPAPPLFCEATHHRAEVLVSAYATPVAAGRNLLPRLPNTEIWASSTPGSRRLTARIAAISLSAAGAVPQLPQTGQRESSGNRRHCALGAERDRSSAKGAWPPRNAPLGVLAVEILPEIERKPDPLGADLGRVRILRASPLIPVPEVCL